MDKRRNKMEKMRVLKGIAMQEVVKIVCGNCNKNFEMVIEKRAVAYESCPFCKVRNKIDVR